MSASLVGSEMCIRDRPMRRCIAWQERSGITWLVHAWSGLWLLGSVAPVSYTHLTLPTICSV
eukprot:14423780-Alexandrium_andersonii.AAC.1